MVRNIVRLLSLLILVNSLGWALRPTISQIRANNITHSSVRFTFALTPGSYIVQIQYGVQPGVYPYQSIAYGRNNSDPVSLAIGALAPSTTYYFRMTARPTAGSTVELCNDNTCGSIEQVVSTLPEPTVHPQMPELPRRYFNPPHPDTSGYTVIPFKVLSDGACVVAQAAGGAAVNDTIPVVLGKIAYGTVLEFPQGANCKIFGEGIFQTGIILPTKPVDSLAQGDINSAAHRWIVFRTQSLEPTDFPPDGVRMTPEYSAKLAKFIAQTPASIAGQNGQVFDTSGTIPHHFWFENIEITHGNASCPADSVDPAPFAELVKMKAQNEITLDSYMVFDRIYLHGLGAPCRLQFGITLGGEYQALINSYLDRIDFWRVAGFPTEIPKIVNSLINFPAQGFRRNSKDAFTRMEGPAVFGLSPSGGAASTWAAYLGEGQNNLLIQYTQPSSGQVIPSCANCTAVAVTQLTNPVNRFLWAGGTVNSNGQMSISFAKQYEYETPSRGITSFGIQLDDGGKGPYQFDNNYVEAYGLSFYIDAGGNPNASNDDAVFSRNHFFWNQNHRASSPTSNGFKYHVRQHWETKRSKRYILRGNVFDGNWSFQNSGPSIFLSGRSSYTIDSANVGVSDFLIESNTIRHGAVGFACMGTSTPPPDGDVTQRILFQNNLMYDLNRYVYDDNGPSFSTGYFEVFPGCQDLTIRKNTMGMALGIGPYIMLLGGGASLAEGLLFRDNLLYFSTTEGGGGFLVDDTPNVAQQPRLPAVNFNGTYKQRLDTYFVRTANTVVPNYIFTNNVILGGKIGSRNNLRDLTQTEVTQFASQFPSGNFFPSGNTLAAREAAAGLLNPQGFDFRLSLSSPYRGSGSNPASDGGTIGVVFDDLHAAQGKVKGISVESGVDALLFRYTAPDARACSIETRPSSATSWSRIMDNISARDRTTVVQNLTPNTEYAYRILCYFTQVNDGVIHTEYNLDEITAGMASTIPQSASVEDVPATVTLSPPADFGVASVVAEYGLTRALGAESSPAVCTASCSVLLPGKQGKAMFYRWKYLNSSGQEVGRSAIKSTIVR